MLSKLNMVIGAFYSEVGAELLKVFSAFDKDARKITKELIIKKDWSEKEFLKICHGVKKHSYNIDSKREYKELDEAIKRKLKGKADVTIGRFRIMGKATKRTMKAQPERTVEGWTTKIIPLVEEGG